MLLQRWPDLICSTVAGVEAAAALSIFYVLMVVQLKNTFFYLLPLLELLTSIYIYSLSKYILLKSSLFSLLMTSRPNKVHECMIGHLLQDHKEGHYLWVQM